MIRVDDTPEYREWYSSIPERLQLLILARLDRIKNHGHFGIVRILGDGLLELKWKNGLRLYFCKTGKDSILYC